MQIFSLQWAGIEPSGQVPTVEVRVVTQTVHRCPLVEGWADQLAYLEIIFKKRIRQVFIWFFE